MGNDEGAGELKSKRIGGGGLLLVKSRDSRLKTSHFIAIADQTGIPSYRAMLHGPTSHHSYSSCWTATSVLYSSSIITRLLILDLAPSRDLGKKGREKKGKKKTPLIRTGNIAILSYSVLRDRDFC